MNQLNIRHFRSESDKEEEDDDGSGSGSKHADQVINYALVKENQEKTKTRMAIPSMTASNS